METLAQQFRPQAEQNVKTRLALEYIAKVENLDATEEDIETEFQKIAEAYGIELDKVKASIDSAAIAADVRVGKAALLVRDNANVTVKDNAPVEVEPEVISAE
jgi:trigger factor